MARRVGDRLPPEVVAAFDGTALERMIGAAFLLITVDGDASPRPCMVSAGEVLSVGDRALRVALWPGTRTANNLDRGDTAVFGYVAAGLVLYVRARPLPLTVTSESPLRCFELVVDSVESDVHEGMPVTAGITFAVEEMDTDAVVSSWVRQLDVLRTARPADEERAAGQASGGHP